MCSTDDNTSNFYNWWNNDNDNWTYITYNWDTTADWNTTVKIWYTCPYCNNSIEWFTKFCPQCGSQLIPDPEPCNKEIIAKLDDLIREINELKAKLIKWEN